jgi:serine protease Do
MKFKLPNIAVAAALAASLAMAQPAAQSVSGRASSSYLGVWVWQIDAARAAELRLAGAMGIEVTRVREGSPAEQAGLRAGDVVTKYGGKRVDSIEQFSKMVRETPVGETVMLEVYRGGIAQMMTAKIASSAGLAPQPSLVLPQPGVVVPDLPRSMTTWRSPVLGVDAEALEGQLAAYFGVKEGVLVRSVVAGSAAEKAGLKAGDVILRVDGRGVASPTDVTLRLRSVTGSSVVLAIMRDRSEINVTVELDDRRAHCCARGGAPV